ncbi:MAG: serine hydrolase [Pseudomonadales bacterium]
MSDYLTRRIWVPFGMESDATWLTDAAGHERGGCCLNMTLRDYARVGLFMLADGAGVLPAGWVKDATLPHLQVGDGSRDYGYFWWITGNTYDALGIFGQMIHVDPQRNLVIAINSAWPAATGRELSAARLAFVNAVAEASDALAQR